MCREEGFLVPADSTQTAVYCPGEPVNHCNWPEGHGNSTELLNESLFIYLFILFILNISTMYQIAV
jgi:hypothetical protein